MRIPGGRGALAAALSAATVLVAGCGTGRPPGVGDVSATELGFTRHAGAVEFPAVGDYVPAGDGLRQLVPVGDCALGIGSYRNGYRDVGVNWTGSADCTRFALDPPPGSGGNFPDGPPSQTGGWRGGGLSGDAVVPWDDGSLLAVGGRIVRQGPDGRTDELADLHLPSRPAPQDETADNADVSAAVEVGSRLLIGGGQYLDRVESPFLFVSDDAGATVRRVPLPPVDGSQPSTPLGRFGVDGKEVVAFGLAASNAYDYTPDGTLAFWHSADAGSHWTASQLTGMPPGTTVRGVLHTAGRWFAVGGYEKPGAHRTDMPLVLTSTDGLHWTRADTAALGSGAVIAATLDAAGRPVLVGSLALPAKTVGARQEYCGSVWLGDGAVTGWRRGELGCAEDPPTAVVTLHDGRVLVAGNRDLWIADLPAKPGG